MSKTTLELFLTVKRQFYYLKRYSVKSITNDMLLKLYNNLFESVCICRCRRVLVLHLKVSTIASTTIIWPPIFTAILKAAIDNKVSQKSPILKRCFQPRIVPF